MSAPNLDDYPVAIEVGTDYAVAISRLLFNAIRHDDYSHDFELTGITTPHLRYREDTDWLAAARELARAVSKRLVRVPHPKFRAGLYRLLDPDAAETIQHENDLAHDLAALLGQPDVWAMLDRMSKAEWDEWKDWLRRKKLRAVSPTWDEVIKGVG